MAGAGFKTFASGEVLTAANVNTYLMQQTVMVFADSSARSTALGANVSEGMLSYLKDTNQVEVYNGSAWVASDDPNAIQNTIVDAKGDLISATAADTPARLAVGANGTYLQADSTTATGLKWGTVSAGGMTQLATGTFSGSQVDLTSISGSYNNLVLVIRNYRPNTDGQVLRMRLNADTGTNYRSTAYNSADLSEVAFTGTTLVLTPATDSTTNNGITYVTLMDYANALTWKMGTVHTLQSGDATVTNLTNNKAQLFFNSTSAITEINLFPASGTFNGGTYILYGVK